MLKVVGASWSRIRLSTWIIGIVSALGIVAIIITETGRGNDDGNYSATAYYSDESGVTIEFWGQGNPLEEIPTGIARAHYDPHISETGWAIFQVETQDKFSDENQAYAAGLLEGALTWQIIYWHWYNNVYTFCNEKKSLCESIRRYLKLNYEWVKATAEEKKVDPYWYQIFLFNKQLDGIEQGYYLGVRRSRQDVEEVTRVDFLWMNAISDLVDLEQKYTANEFGKFRKDLSATPWRHKHSKEDWELKKKAKSYDCGFEGLPLSSSFVKLLHDKESIFFAHNSGGPYSQMLKMFKKYEFRFHVREADDTIVPGSRLSFSSYPGAIHSMDDFYVLGNQEGRNMAVSAIPIAIFNHQLWHLVNAKSSILLGPRSMTANRLARNPEEWAHLFSNYNLSTGSRQWVVVDMASFDHMIADKNNHTPFSDAQNLLWVVEQVPGSVVAADQTQVLLEQTYWAGYGVPFYSNISEVSGFKKMEQEHGETFSYNKTALANIFRRDQANVTNFQSVMNLMRSNLYKVDPLSEGNPRCAIGSRGDVKGISSEPEPMGVTDIKVLKNNSPNGVMNSVKTIHTEHKNHVDNLPLESHPHIGRIPKHLQRRTKHMPSTGNTLHISTNVTVGTKGSISRRIDVRALRNSTYRVFQTTSRLYIAAGPAFSSNTTPDALDDMAPFSWSNSTFQNISHIGQPDSWQFTPIGIDFI